MKRRFPAWVTAVLFLSACCLVFLSSGCRSRRSGELRRPPSKAAQLSPKDIRQVERSAARALIAIRDQDVPTYRQLLISRSLDHLPLRHVGKPVLAAEAEEYRLGEMADQQIRRGVHYVPNAKRRLLESIANFTVEPEYPNPSKLQLAAIRFTTPTRKELLIVLIKEDGKWKISAAPALTTRVLKYDTIEDAAHDRGCL